MKNDRKKRQKNRRRKGIGPYRRSMAGVILVLLLLGMVVAVNARTLREKEKYYQAQEAELEKQLEEERERAAEIDDLEEYVGTDAYVEELAKDKLGLVNENEIIFKAK